tara:strand:+ start:4803 stop:5693 length:891 start_codon:yes stop_codon:yes gene_type:complete
MIKKTIEYIRIPKKLFFGVLIGAMILFLVLSLKPKKTPVDLGLVTRGVFQKTIIDEGVTSFKNKFVVTAPADGITPTLKLKAGDMVKKGQILVRFEWDSDFKIKSPLDGDVLRVFEKDRRHVMRGTPILEVGDPRKIEIVAKLLSEEVVDVRVGQKAKITKWGKDQPLDAVVRKIEPSAKEEVSALGVKEQRVKVHLDIITDQSIWKNLGDGFRVEVSIITMEKKNVSLLPIGSLFSDQGKPAVFVVNQNKAHLKHVKVGEQNSEYIELENGVDVGTQVVLYPGSGLKDGVKVQER